MAGDLLRPFEQLRVRDDFVDEAYSQRLLRIDWFVRQQYLHGIDVAQLLGEQAGAGAMTQPALGQERKLEARVLGARDPDVGRRKQNVQAGTRRPAVYGGDHRLPHPRIVIAHAPVDSGLLAVRRSCQRPEDALGTEILALLLRYVLARREVVTAAEVRIALAGQDCAADRAIFPEIDPRLGNRVGRRLVEDVCLGGVVQRDVRDAVALLIFDGQAVILHKGKVAERALPFSSKPGSTSVRDRSAMREW